MHSRAASGTEHPPKDVFEDAAPDTFGAVVVFQDAETPVMLSYGKTGVSIFQEERCRPPGKGAMIATSIVGGDHGEYIRFHGRCRWHSDV